MKLRVMIAAAFALYLTALAGAAPSTSPVADAAMRADRGRRPGAAQAGRRRRRARRATA